MKNARPTEVMTSACERRHSKPTASFLGNCNESETRALHVLLRGAVSREALDIVSGWTNSPALVQGLREKGLRGMLLCKRETSADATGRRGVYWLTPEGKAAASAWLAKQAVAP